MFKQIVRSNGIRKIIRLRRGLLDGASTDADEFEKRARKRIGLEERSIDSAELDGFKELQRSILQRIAQLTYQDGLMRSLDDSNNIKHLLWLIQTRLGSTHQSDSKGLSGGALRNGTELGPDHLEVIYSKFRRLFFELKFGSTNSVEEFYRALSESPQIEPLLDRTSQLIGKLSTPCLIDVLYSFTLILNQDPQSQYVRDVIKQLEDRLSVLTPTEIADCLEIISRYQISPPESDALRGPNLQYFGYSSGYASDLPQFVRSLIEVARQRLTSSALDSSNVHIILRYFFIFLNPNNDPTYKTMIYLAEGLCSPKVQIDFERSVILLRKIKTNHLFMKEGKTNIQNELFTKSINKLIFKCNSTIFDVLSGERRREDFDFYLRKIHDFINPIGYEFLNFYDKRLIGLLAQFLIEHLDNKKSYKHFVYNLVYNYSKFFTFDERLLKLLYDLCCKDEKIMPKIAVSNFYYLFSKYRLSFVDHTLLATKLLLNSSDHHHRTMDYYKQNPLKILCQLILNDVTDDRLLIYFDAAADKQGAFYGRISFSQYKEIALARVHLETIEVDEALRRHIGQKLDRTTEKILLTGQAPKISRAFIRINNKLQSNAYLSNNVFIYPVGIYDRRLQNLISLSGYEFFFQEIDHFPLNDDQEIFTFLESNRLEGNIPPIELNYNYQLKKVLKRLWVKPIDVFIEDLKDLSPVGQVDFYMRKALDFFRSSPRGL